MEYALVGLLIVFLVFLFVETRRKSQRIKRAVAEQKRNIADDSGMTANLGAFAPDIQTTVVIGASEELGIFYYRMLKLSKVIIRSRINLANLATIEFLVNGQPHPVNLNSEQPTASLRASEIADNVIMQMSTDSLRQVEKAGMRIIFYDETGQDKTLEITTLRSSDERQRFERVQLLKNTIWWVAFLQMTSRQARRIRASLENGEPVE